MIIHLRKCFGTTEYSEKSFICNKCELFNKCESVYPKKQKIQKKEVLYKRVIKWPTK